MTMVGLELAESDRETDNGEADEREIEIQDLDFLWEDVVGI